MPLEQEQLRPLAAVEDVRAGAAEGLGNYGGAAGGSLLVHRLAAGDEPRVLLACAGAALEVAAEFVEPRLEAWLHDTAEERRPARACTRASGPR